MITANPRGRVIVLAVYHRTDSSSDNSPDNTGYVNFIEVFM